MRSGTIAIVVVGTLLGIIVGCACPSIGGGYQPVVSGRYVVDESPYGQQYNDFDWLPIGYVVDIDREAETVTETYDAAEGTHVVRYRVVTVAHLGEDYGHVYQAPEM